MNEPILIHGLSCDTQASRLLQYRWNTVTATTSFLTFLDLAKSPLGWPIHLFQIGAQMKSATPTDTMYLHVLLYVE